MIEQVGARTVLVVSNDQPSSRPNDEIVPRDRNVRERT